MSSRLLNPPQKVCMTSQVEEVEFGVGYKLYREFGESEIRLVAKKIDPYDQANYSMRVVEITRDNVLRLYRRWSFPWDWGEKIILEVRLEHTSAEKVRNYIRRVQSLSDYDKVAYWLLTARYRVMPSGEAVIDNEVREPRIL